MAHATKTVPRLHVVERGPEDRPTVVLVHGSMDRASGMSAVTRSLKDEFRVVTYDRRGYARSRLVGGPFDVDTQVADLVGVLAGRPAVVFGHSHGGNIALAAAQRHPELVRAVGAYEPPMAWQPWWPTTTAAGRALEAQADGAGTAAESFLRRMVGDDGWARLPAATKEERRADGPALLGDLDVARRGPMWDADRIAVPVLLARGERCAPHHVRSATVLADLFASVATAVPVEMVVVPGAAHGIHFQDPVALAELVRRADALVTAP